MDLEFSAAGTPTASVYLEPIHDVLGPPIGALYISAAHLFLSQEEAERAEMVQVMREGSP